MSIEIGRKASLARIPHLEELERTWLRYESEASTDAGRALGRRMAKAQREAIEAIQAGTTDALLARRAKEAS